MTSTSKAVAITSVASNGAISLAPQALAMLTLGSAEFGLFSALYLSSTLVLALTLACVCDPWSVLNRRPTESAANLYPSLLVSVVGILLIPATIANFVISRDLLVTVLTTTAVGVSIYRVGGRFWTIHWGMFRRALWSDVVFILFFLVGFFVPISFGMQAFHATLVAWLVGSIGGLVGMPAPSFHFTESLRWLRNNRKVLRPLVIDTGLAELSIVGTPYLLLPVMGFSTFGIYRGIGNLSAPVRAAFSSVRPLVMRDPLRFCGKKLVGAIVALSLLLGMMATFALIAIDMVAPNLGIFSTLRPFAVAAGVCVTGTVLVTVYGAVTRALSITSRLVVGRTSQLALGLAFPLGGYLVGGVWLGIWGFAVGTVCSGVIWMFCSIAAQPNKMMSTTSD